MNIEELKELFFGRGQCDSYNKTKKPITKLKWILKQAEKEKIQFAIEVWEELDQVWVGDSKVIYVSEVEDKIKNLKQYLDEKV